MAFFPYSYTSDVDYTMFLLKMVDSSNTPLGFMRSVMGLLSLLLVH